MSESTVQSTLALPKKVCFVTIGATASFASLIHAVLTTGFFDALQKHQYTDLLVQYGKDGEDLYTRRLKEVQDTDFYAGLRVSGFGLDGAGLGRYMRLARGGENDGVEGVVVSHAGMPMF